MIAKRLVKICLVAISIFGVSGTALANTTPDEQWRPPAISTPLAPTDYIKTAQIADLPQAWDSFSRLWAVSSTGPGTFSRYSCTNMTDLNCADPQSYEFQSILPVCQSDSDVDCIESLEAKNGEGSYQKGKFLEYNMKGAVHPNNFSSLQKYNIPNNSNPSIWSLANASHASGDRYVVNVGIKGFRETQNLSSWLDAGNIYAFVAPVSVRNGAISEVPQCRQASKSELNNVIANTRCTGSEFAYSTPDQPRCVVSYGTSGDCMASETFPSGVYFAITVRLSNGPNGWFHGRMTDPSISIESQGKQTKIRIAASPVQVPIFYHSDRWENLAVSTKNWWKNSFSTCNRNPECGPAGGSNPEDPTLNIETTSAGITQFPYGNFAMNMINSFAPQVGDKAVSAPRVWSFRTLNTTSQELNKCVSKGDGLKGIVTTNSTSYSEGAPEFKNNSLSYKVASLHLLPNGETFRGTYDLILRSDVARCIYSFSNAPISATIEVLNSDGSNQIATTTVNEKKGWLYLSAKNFTFSSPTVKVKLIQNEVQPSASPSASTTPQSVKSAIKKITCMKGRTKKVISGTKPKCPVGFKAA